MPTFAFTTRAKRDFHKLSQQEEQRFRRVVVEQFVTDLKAGPPFRRSLRVKGVQGAPGVYEMTWAKDGRATWQYGDEQKPGEPHIIWRRVGAHATFCDL
ncbi:MAG: hypothetical protein ACRDRL_10420 [Sciscionella sp.]